MPLDTPGNPLYTQRDLRQILNERFSISELKDLCFSLNIDFEDFPSSNKIQLVVELIAYFNRTGRLQELTEYVIDARPQIDWPPLTTQPKPEEAPYKGLEFFRESDAHLFFGRESIVKELVYKVHQSNFLAVVGSSGSGKSSVVHARLIPSLKREGNWLVYAITPTDRPLLSLANALTRDTESVTIAVTLMDDMVKDDRSLDLHLRRSFSKPMSSKAGAVNPKYRQYLTELRDALRESFDAEEIRNICYKLQANYVFEPNRTLTENALELITFLERRERINELVQVVRQMRPNRIWDDPPIRIMEATQVPKKTTLPTRLLLIIDQFEELFTLCRDETERRSFINNLVNAAQANSLATIVIVLRADFYAHALQYDGLRQALAQNQIIIGPMTREELRQVIERPAEAASLNFEAGLVERILDDGDTEPGALPLISHALRVTWERRKGLTLTHAGYQAAGGIRGAFVQSAETVYLNLNSEEQLWARRIFLQLIELGEGTVDTRRRISKNDLIIRLDNTTDAESTPKRIAWGTRMPPDLPTLEDAIIIKSVLTTLINARLIVVDLENVEIAHEALIREWPRLREWLDEDRENLRVHRQLSRATQEWLMSGRNDSFLYRGTRLVQIREWVQINPEYLNEVENQFIIASEQSAKPGFSFPPEITWNGCLFTLRRSGLLLTGVIIVIILIVVALSSANRTVQTLPFVALALLIVIYLFNRNWNNIVVPFQNWSSARSHYSRYAEQWEGCTPLQKLVLLLAPANTSFSAEDLESQFSILGAGSDASNIQLSLTSLTQKEMVVEENGKWRIAHHKPLVRHRQEQHARLISLITQTREENPFFKRAFEFLRRAGLTIEQVLEKPVYLCQAGDSLSPALQSQLSFPVCLSFFIGTHMNGDHILKIREWAKELDGKTNSVLLLTNCRLTDAAWAQIGTLNLSSFHIIPIDHVSVDEGLAKKREGLVLAAEVEKWLGLTFDPYAESKPVTGVFSFFGREAQITQLLRNLENGTSFGIFGLRKMGKTSLLKTLRDRAPYPVTLVSAQPSLTALYQRSFEYWAQWIKVHYHREWQPPKITRDESPGAFATKIIGLFDWLKSEGLDARLGLFLDEAETIVPDPEETGEKLHLYLGLVRALRGLIDEDHPLTLVVASLNPSITRINNWGREQNPTYSLFKENNLPPLTQDDCIQMVRNIGSQVGLVYDEDSLQAIADLSGGHPFLARQLCSVLFSLRDRELGQIRRDEIDGAVHHFIYSDQTVPYLDAGIWQDAGNAHLWSSPEQAEENQSVLLELAKADGLLSTEDLLSPNPAVRRESIIGLTNYGIIYDPEPGLYAIKFGLLREWLRHRKLGLG
jgi:hypothetical protein